MKTEKAKTLILAGLLTLGSSACMLTDPVKERDGAFIEFQSDSSGASETCGFRGFSYFVQPMLRSNCMNCHSGSGPGPGDFASSNRTSAYFSAKSRSSFANAANSLLVSKSSVSGHGGNCSTCGSEWGQTLSRAIAQWAEAELENPTVCSALPGSGASGFDDGDFNPSEGTEVTVVPEGLSRFSEPGGTHAILRLHCSECHLGGKLAAFAPFGDNDSLTAYKAAKPRVNFVEIASSQLLNRAKNANHCGICGDAALVSALTARIEDWRNDEISGAAASRVRLDEKLIGISSPGQSVSLRWDLGSESSVSDQRLNGAVFEVDVSVHSSGTVYLFTAPRIHTAGSAIRVKAIRFLRDGAEDPLIATFTTVDQVVPANRSPGPVLSGGTALAPISEAPGESVGFTFEILSAQ